jgi:RES domain-containing protein
MRIYRISNHRDLNGEGGLRAAGRWHNMGRPIVYCAASPAGAILEAIVYIALSDPTLVPATFQLLTIELPDDLKRDTVPGTRLPPNWQAHPAATRALGEAWLLDGASPVLTVPSALAPQTENYLLNPAHPDLLPPGEGLIKIVQIASYPFDSRLFAGPQVF